MIKEQELKTNLKTIFKEDLLSKLRKWRAKRDRVVLVVNANKDIVDGVIYREL